VKTVQVQGKECEVIAGKTAAEDDEYIWIIGTKNGNKHYLCHLCGYDFHGHDGGRARDLALRTSSHLRDGYMTVT
jgi:hypothetical protein